MVAVVLGCSQRPNDTEEPNPLAKAMCTADLRAAVSIEVRDMATGEPAACGASAEIRDGDYVEPLTGQGSCAIAPETFLEGAWERVGTYTVTIRKAGYQEWVRSQVVVIADQCHVQTVTLQALLEPS